MVNELSWKECIETGIITITEPDKERSRKMHNLADTRLEFWDKKVDNKFTSLKVEAYYNIIKELIFACLYKEGYNCANHVCLIACLKEKIKNFDFEIEKINELRKVRNEISYRGLITKTDYLERNELEFKHIINRLKAISL